MRRNFIESFVTLSTTTSLGQLFLVFAVSAIVSTILTLVGRRVEDRVEFTKWHGVAVGPFVTLAFFFWLIAAISLLSIIVALGARLFS